MIFFIFDFFILNFFFTLFFSTIYVPSDNANYLVCFVLYDTNLDQRIEKRRRKHSQTENQTDSLVHFMTKSKGKAQISPTLPKTLNKRNISGITVNNKAPVSVVSDKCV